MATRKKATTYEPHTIPSKITVTSRCAIKIRDNYYTIEASAERQVVNPETADMDREWAVAFDEVNLVVDNQIQEITNSFKK